MGRCIDCEGQCSCSTKAISQNSVQGKKGDAGLNGKTPILQMGTVTTLNPTDPATAQISLLSGVTYKLDLGIPRGHDGNNGEVGPPAPPPSIGQEYDLVMPANFPQYSDTNKPRVQQIGNLLALKGVLWVPPTIIDADPSRAASNHVTDFTYCNDNTSDHEGVNFGVALTTNWPSQVPLPAVAYQTNMFMSRRVTVYGNPDALTGAYVIPIRDYCLFYITSAGVVGIAMIRDAEYPTSGVGIEFSDARRLFPTKATAGEYVRDYEDYSLSQAADGETNLVTKNLITGGIKPKFRYTFDAGKSTDVGGFVINLDGIFLPVTP